LSTSTIAVGGGDRYYYNPENRFINRGLIDTNGPALVSDNGATGGLTASNEGRIRARLISTDQFAVDLDNESYFSNSGAISAIGGGAVRITVATRLQIAAISLPTGQLSSRPLR
jgi:hypothetical protein